MFGLTHLLAGLIIGKITGNYLLAITFSLVIDLDHIVPFIKTGAYKSLKKIYAFATDEKDPFGSPRIFFHSIYSFIVVSAIAFIINPSAGIIVGSCYFVHLIMDIVDSSDFKIFYPYGPNFVGPIKYFSKTELVFGIFLLAIFFII